MIQILPIAIKVRYYKKLCFGILKWVFEVSIFENFSESTNYNTLSLYSSQKQGDVSDGLSGPLLSRN
jgi:hypothetical protein